MHCHDTSSEIIFILSGNGKTVCDGTEESVTAGDCLYCKKGSSHTLINNGTAPLVFYAVVAEQ
jgi:mannose-6-phosphate isomerase-like protein (cupin superfamily)